MTREEILIVDDDAVNSKLLENLLNKTGYNTHCLSSGEECLAYLESQQPALVLLDILMSGLDGIAVVDKIRSTFSKESLPVIMVTTMAQGIDISASLAAGANDYVTKPVDHLILLARIGNQLSLRSAHIEKNRKSDELERALGIQRAIGDELPAGILVHDQSGQTVYTNQTLNTYCESDNCKLNNLFHILMGGVFESELEKLFKEANTSPAYTGRLELESGGMDPKWLEVFTNPIPLEDGEALRLWLFRDRTEIKLLERKIQEQVRLETVGVFSTGVAHNFNNVMASISGATDLLKKMLADNAMGEKCLDIVKRSLEGGKALTDKMFALKPVEFEDGADPVCLSTLIAELISNLSEAEAAKSIDFKLNLDSDIKLKTNPKNIQTILSNLISNSIDASKTGDQIVIETKVLDDGKHIQISVLDHGTGMSEKVQQKVMEPFFTTKNLDKVNNVGRLGNGLGMWNVHNLVLSLGGKLDLK
ncbi:MAG: response regulator, partial [Bdellovibrionota bacterium]